MKNGIKTIVAEIKIEAISQEAALVFAEAQRIDKSLCSWKRNGSGEDGRLYIGGVIYFDSQEKNFSFSDPGSQ